MSIEKLAPCPDSPNCAQSRYPEHKSYVPPLSLADSSERLPTPEKIEKRWKLLESIVLAQPRTQVVESEAGILRVEFRSRLFGFVDDVEFVLDKMAGLVHLRSASRVGYYDFGVNRKRIQKLRSLLNRAMETYSSGGP